jgi:hypothetical protein
MEYENMLEYMKDKDLDNFEWNGDIIKIPCYKEKK